MATFRPPRPPRPPPGAGTPFVRIAGLLLADHPDSSPAYNFDLEQNAGVSAAIPEHTELPAGSVERLCSEFGVRVDEMTKLADTGIFNAVYRLGDCYVLRVPRNHPAHFEALHREALIVPKARAAGIRTPELVRYDASTELLPVPYAVYELVHGRNLEQSLGRPLIEAPDPWSELGQDLARLHSKVDGNELRVAEEIPNPIELLFQRRGEGWLSSLDAEWLGAWLEVLTEAATDSSICVTHGDVQATNVLVDEAGAYQALIDWGSAKLDDPACDFAGVPIRTVPAMLTGYQAAGGAVAGLAPRIVRRHLQLALLLLPRGSVPGRSWAERPLPMLLEVLYFFADPPAGWENLAPATDRSPRRPDGQEQGQEQG